MNESRSATDSLASMGGQARAASLDPETRSDIARRAAEARWGGEVKTAYFAGDIKVGDLVLSCAVLEDGTRVINQSTMLFALGRNPQKSRRSRGTSDLRPPFLLANNLQEFIGNDLKSLTSPIRYKLSGRGSSWSYGYKAEILPLVCEVYLRAKDADKLDAKQIDAASAAYLLMRGLARVGITALVDEATGYQDVRAHDELQRLIEKYVQAELRPWVKMFPDEFFKGIYKIYGWNYQEGSVKHPKYVGAFINRHVYEQLPPGVLDEIRRLNPKNARGNRNHRHHQFLTVDTGNVQLDKQISTVTTLMRIAESKNEFEDLFDRAFADQQKLPLVVEVDDV